MATHSGTTGDTLYSKDSNSFRRLYAKEVEIYEQSEDFFAPMEGKGTSSLIWSKSDTAASIGSKITFTTRAGFYSEGVFGDDAFGDDDYEKTNIGSYDLIVDFLRQGTKQTIRAEEYMGLQGLLKAGIPQEQGKWLGREKTARLFMMYKHKGNAANTRFAGTATSVDALTSNDTFSHDMVVEFGRQLGIMNGKPAMVGRDKDGNEIRKYCVIASTETLNSLETDVDYMRNLRDASDRGQANYIFSGGYANLRGNVIKEYTAFDHDGEGPLGSPIVAKGELGAALADANVGNYIQGGGSTTAAANTRAKFTRFFPNYAYKYQNGDTLATSGSATYYVIIVNPSDAATDPGKFGFYSYNVNDGNKLTINGALRSGGSLGGLDFDAAVNTNVHPVGAPFYLVNSKAVTYGQTLILGAGSALRGYGKYTRELMEQKVEGGFATEFYIVSSFGQTPRKDVRGRCPGYLIINHAINIPGLRYTPKLS